MSKLVKIKSEVKEKKKGKAKITGTSEVGRYLGR